MNITVNRTKEGSRISFQESGELAIISIHRPELKNAMNAQMWEDMYYIMKKIPMNAKTKAVVFRGADGDFTAGSDIKEFNNMSTSEEVNKVFDKMEKVFVALEKLPLPTIAVIDGVAFGAGLQLALSCDLRIGTPNTRLGMPLGKLGITISKKFAKRIIDLIGPSRMKDLIYTSRIVSSEEAYEWGMINYHLTEKNVDRFALKLANKIKKNSKSSLLAAKETATINTPYIDTNIQSSFEPYIDTKDFFEGTQAFVEKRRPNFYR